MKRLLYDYQVCDWSLDMFSHCPSSFVKDRISSQIGCHVQMVPDCLSLPLQFSKRSPATKKTRGKEITRRDINVQDKVIIGSPKHKTHTTITLKGRVEHMDACAL